MKRQTQVRKDLQSKKVAVLTKNNPKTVAAWLKPGDKLKYDEKDTKDYYLDLLGDIPYKHVWVNNQEGYIVSAAITL